ncbi:MAG: sulfate adenylyltransferase [Candidatus Nanohaloarchaea archaeon]
MMIPPHGGKLVDRTVNGEKKERLMEEAEEKESIKIGKDLVKDLQNIADGRYSPLTGFMDKNNFLKVVEDMTLEDGTVWTVPIVLDIDEEQRERIENEDRIVLEHGGKPLAFMEVDEIYEYDKEEAAEKLYRTDDTDHPGVEMYLDKDDFLVGGDIQMIQNGFDQFKNYNLAPKDTRVLFKHKGWDTVVGFQTRNAPHRGHEYLQKSAMEHVDAVLVHPKIGAKKTGDYRDEVILKAYRSLIQNYYPGHSAMSIFTAKMRYMGPREAVFDAIVRKNHGCTHFIVGRDHAGVGDYYGDYEAQEIFDEIGAIGIEPMFYDYAFYCRKCQDTVSEKTCPHGQEHHVTPSGTKIRNMLSEGKTPPEEMMRPEVAETVTSFEEPLVK